MLFFIQYLALPPAHWDADLSGHSPRKNGRKHSCPGADKRFSCLEVEPAEDARPEVQATAIKVKGTPARREESMATKTNLLPSGELRRACGADPLVRRF